MKRLHIIDMDNVLHVGTKAGHSKNYNVASVPTGGIYNLISTLRKHNIVSDPVNNPVIFVYDTGKSFRKEIYPAYKAHRKEKSNVELIRDRAVSLQKEITIKELLEKAGYMVLGKEGYEADDLMFNIVLHFACLPDQPLTKGELSIHLHTSDEDWVGAMGLAPNIYLEATVNSSKLNQTGNYYEFTKVTGERVEDCYLKRAIYGDNDGYDGFGKTYRETLQRTTNEIYHLEEAQEYFYQRYWDRLFWIELYNKYYSGYPELLEEMTVQTNLAFPIYMEELFNANLGEYLNRQIDINVYGEFTDLLRIKTLERILGKLNPYSEQHAKALEYLKQEYANKYSDVFELYKNTEYLPELKITADQVNDTFLRNQQ